MKQYLLLAASAFLLQGCQTSKEDIKEQPLKMIEQIDFSHVKINDNFWSPRLSKHVSATLPVCIDQIENQTGRIRNFENAAKGEGEHSGIFFDDSDVYKALEGMAYSLINNPDPELEKKADEWIDKFAAAQQPDGYINTFYTLTGLDKRWTNMDKHEMYCAGHMIEAGVAYYQATGKRKLLDVCIRMTDHMMSQFGPGKRHWVPGHEEIELALVKLYQTTQEQKYLDFAYWLLEERGHGHGTMGDEGKWDPVYYQDIVPVRRLTDISGHAVRCMYLYCGMADVAAITGDSSYIKAIDKIWENIVGKKIYITGGIGARHAGEAFGDNYELPNLTAYNETCAAIGNVYMNYRLFLLHGDSKYFDVLERTLYNGLISGVSLDGGKFFYPNPLSCDGKYHFNADHTITRQPWFGCACCPSNISRFIPSLPGYVYAVKDNQVYVNLFLSNRAELKLNEKKVVLEQETGYPWNGDIRVKVAQGNLPFTMNIRIPGWVRGSVLPSDLYSYADDLKLGYRVLVNGEEVTGELRKGYLRIDRKWKKGDVVEVHFDMHPRVVKANEKVVADRGRVAVERGPIVYCAEWADNDFNIQNIILNRHPKFQVTEKPELLYGINEITTEVQALGFDAAGKLATRDVTLTLIPYYAWAHRGEGKMDVWLPVNRIDVE